MQLEQTMRYETEGMKVLRCILTLEHSKTNEQVDTFKSCLIALERHGFTLTRKE